MQKITSEEIASAEQLAADSRKCDIAIFVRITLGAEVPPGVDLSALLERIDRYAPSDADLAWSVVRHYWLLCNERSARFREFCEVLGGPALWWILPRQRSAYISLALLGFRAVTGCRLVPLRRMQNVFAYLFP